MSSSQRYYSTVYWHFTGSPKGIDWRKITRPAEILVQGSPKLDVEAVSIIEKILFSQKLLATAIVDTIPEIPTDPFCCVTDIPLKDLPRHSIYYGKAAIGFKASAIYKQFLPVFYLSMNLTPYVDNNIPDSQAEIVTKLLVDNMDAIKESLTNAIKEHGTQISLKQKYDGDRKGPMMNYIKVTDFSVAPEETFYCEREWRKVGDFCFQSDDVAVIVVPEKYLGRMRKYVYEELGYPPTVSLIAWELIEQV